MEGFGRWCCPFQFPDAICMVYLPTFNLKYMVNVGKYSSPMEHLGLGGFFGFKFCWLSGVGMVETRQCWVQMKRCWEESQIEKLHCLTFPRRDVLKRPGPVVGWITAGGLFVQVIARWRFGGSEKRWSLWREVGIMICDVLYYFQDILWYIMYIYIFGHPPSQGLPAGGGVSHIYIYLHLHLSKCGTCKNHCKYQCFLNTLYVKWFLLQSSVLNKTPNNAKPESGSPFSKISTREWRPSAQILRFTIKKTLGKCIFVE